MDLARRVPSPRTCSHLRPVALPRGPRRHPRPETAASHARAREGRRGARPAPWGPETRGAAAAGDGGRADRSVGPRGPPALFRSAAVGEPLEKGGADLKVSFVYETSSTPGLPLPALKRRGRARRQARGQGGPRAREAAPPPRGAPAPGPGEASLAGAPAPLAPIPSLGHLFRPSGPLRRPRSEWNHQKETLHVGA